MKSFLLLVLSLMAGKHGCQAPFIQTAYRTAKTTITCDYPGNTHLSSVKVFCKDNNLICEDILSIKSSSLSNGTFTLRETSSGFNVSISDVSSQDAAVYWCGVESNDGRYRAAFRKIQLQVKDITTFSRSLTAGQNFTYWCRYPNGASVKKFICKGEDPSVCQRLASTASPKKNTKFSMKDDIEKRNITITVREVTTDDTGTYWCGAESTAQGRSNLFFNRLLMTAVPSATSPPSFTQPVTVPYGSFDHASVLTIVVALALDVLLLLLMLTTYFLYTRFASCWNTRRGA
ncbi:polymeric immunoglobulin receptor-like isoform X2 [Chelmon rostratus]|uniref:polymeric immunoglobulin receptor-like isoform X2 n=1 Tax=Chelmon rostratus TaxID=109905 RepID=UPI001BE6522F|nr:polymeric immunoglobulin receptor-like isoform X2 [Chelmon rostratus]